MSTFQFQDNTIHLDIAGHKFQLAARQDLTERLVAAGKQMQEFEKACDEKDPEAFKKSVAFMHGAIDVLLGEGAAAKIFEGREADLYDCLDVFSYISSEVGAFAAQKQERYGKYLPNRLTQNGK